MNSEDAYLREVIGEYLEEAGLGVAGFDEAEAKKLALELKEDIVNAFLDETTQRHRTDSASYFNSNSVKVTAPTLSSDGLSLMIDIKFSKWALSRKSLYNLDKNGAISFSNNKGVYDIFGLFTKGYTAKSVVRGFWGLWDKNELVGDVDGPLGSRAHRDSSSFIADTIQKFVDKHPGVQITYPEEWGYSGTPVSNNGLNL